MTSGLKQLNTTSCYSDKDYVTPAGGVVLHVQRSSAAVFDGEVIAEPEVRLANSMAK
jgi:hypothetical protein